MRPIWEPLLGLAGVPDALSVARTAIDAALGHPALRRRGGAVAAEVGLRSAVASAALAGHAFDPEAVRAGLVADHVVAGALRVSAALDGMAGVWRSAPFQALAKLHVLAAAGTVGAAGLGVLRRDPGVAERLDRLRLAVVHAPAGTPGLLVAAVVHGELLAVAPFAGPSDVVARGAARLALIAGGVDPRGLLPMDVGHERRRPEYAGASGAFATGTPDGLRAWLRHYAAAAEAAAGELTVIAGEVGAGSPLAGG